jgi:hypothetical protein
LTVFGISQKNIKTLLAGIADKVIGRHTVYFTESVPGQARGGFGTIPRCLNSISVNPIRC